MPYVIQRDESLSAAVLRIMNEQIARARERLTDTDSPAEKRIHDARKRFKEARALIRLVREPLGRQFAIENAWYRDAGRELAAVREEVAIVEALEKLVVSAPVLRAARRAIDRTAPPRQLRPLDVIVAGLVEQLPPAQARIAGWPPIADSFEAIAAGLARTYRAGRNAMAHGSSADDLHEWRKRVKEHWYHVQLLRAAWPPMMKAYSGVMESLSDALGDHHDLHLLRGRIGVRQQTLIAAIDARQNTLVNEATGIGRRVYAEPTRRWLARMRNCWRVWRAT